MTMTTTLIATPDPDEDGADTQSACPAGLPWCNDVCLTYDGADAGHHSSGFDTIDISRGVRGETTLSMSVFRTDEDDKPGPVLIFLGLDNSTDEMILTAGKSRQLAAMLMDAADDADPLPLGVMAVKASTVRVDDELLTDDGWQTITGLMVFKEPSQVSVFTPERTDEDSDGWQFAYDDFVPVRRALNDGVAWVSAVPR